MQATKVFIPIKEILKGFKDKKAVEEIGKKYFASGYEDNAEKIVSALRKVFLDNGDLAYTQRHFFGNLKPKGIEIEQIEEDKAIAKIIFENEKEIEINDFLNPVDIEVLEKVITSKFPKGFLYVVVFFPYSEVDEYLEDKLRKLILQSKLEIDTDKFLEFLKGIVKLHKESEVSYYEEFLRLNGENLEGISLIVVKDALLWKRIKNGDFSGSWLVRFYQNYKLKRDWLFRKLKELDFDDSDLKVLESEITKVVDYSPLFKELMDKLSFLEMETIPIPPLNRLNRKEIEDFKKAIREIEIYLFGDKLI